MPSSWPEPPSLLTFEVSRHSRCSAVLCLAHHSSPTHPPPLLCMGHQMRFLKGSHDHAISLLKSFGDSLRAQATHPCKAYLAQPSFYFPCHSSCSPCPVTQTFQTGPTVCAISLSAFAKLQHFLKTSFSPTLLPSAAGFSRLHNSVQTCSLGSLVELPHLTCPRLPSHWAGLRVLTQNTLN